MSDYKRLYVPGGTYFFTVNLQDRQASHLTEHIDVLRNSVQSVRKKRPFKVVAWVVLPEHMHTIWALPEIDQDYSGRWREIKKHFGKSLPNTESRTTCQLKRVNEVFGSVGFGSTRFVQSVTLNVILTMCISIL